MGDAMDHDGVEAGVAHDHFHDGLGGGVSIICGEHIFLQNFLNTGEGIEQVINGYFGLSGTIVAIAAGIELALILKGPFALLAEVRGDGAQTIFQGIGQGVIFRRNEAAMTTGEEDGDHLFENLVDRVAAGEIKTLSGIACEAALFTEAQAAGERCDRGFDPGIGL